MFHLALMLSDTVMLGAAFFVAYWIRFHAGLPYFVAVAQSDITYYSRLVLLVIPLWLFLFWVAGLYRDKLLLGGTQEYAQVFNSVSTGMLIVISATFFLQSFVVARGWLVVSWVLAFLLAAGARFAMRRVVYRLRRRGYFLSPAVIVGTNEEALALAEQLAGWETSGLRILGFVDPTGGAPKECGGLRVLGAVGELEGLVVDHSLEEVVIATSALSRRQLVELFRRFAMRDGIRLRLSSGLFEIMTTGLEVKELAYVPLINLQPVRLTGVDVVLKLILDFAIALFVVVVASPAYLALAVAVKLDSRGPVIHRRRVLGLGGYEFDAFKFRTMHENGDEILAEHPGLREELAHCEKIKEDPRVTGVGRFMRKLSLDELPQAFNVLLGQMSIVGPRMITKAEHTRYRQWDMNLLTVKPGITGLWQISGRSDISYEERVQLDMNYIRNWTIWLDLHILLRTIPAVLRGRGAY